MRKRPSPVCLRRWASALGFVVLVVGLANLARAVLAWRYATLLPGLSLTAPLEYLAAMGVFWGLALVTAAVGLLRRRSWGRWAALAAVTVYEVHVWINHLLFDASDYARRTWPWNLLLTVLLLAAVWGSLSLPAVRKMFDKEGD